MFPKKSSKLLFVVLLLLVSSISATVATIGAQVASTITILADFEGTAPPGFFVFNGASSVVTTPISVADTDPLARPSQSGDNGVLQVDYNVSDFGGFGQAFEGAGPQDWSSFESFSFWFYGSGSGLTYQAEISDNRSDPTSDTSERFDYPFTDTAAGWQLISIPFADFTRATDFQPGGAPDDGFTLTEIWAWAIVLPQGADTIYFDDFALQRRIVDDFENGLPSGTDANGVPVGFYTFQGPGSAIAIATTFTPPSAVPGSAADNNVMQVDVDATDYAGFIHGFENGTADAWVSQDWSAFGGLALWLYGNGSGTDLFIDLLENRNPGSTTDDAQRWTVTFKDDFTGWQYLEFPFDTFVLKSIGNGAPNDGLTLEEVYGWAFGTLGTGGPIGYYLDDVSLYGVAETPELAVSFSAAEYAVTEGDQAIITVRLTRELGDVAGDPAEVTVDYSTEPGTATSGRDYTPVSGTLTFTQGGPSELTFAVPTFDNPKRDGDKTAILRLTNAVSAPPGLLTQAVLAILDDDTLDPTLLDDFERGSFLWFSDNVTLTTPEVAAGEALAVPGQGAYERFLEVNTDIAVDILIKGTLCQKGNGVIPVAILTTDSFNALTVDHNTVRFGDAAETHRNKKTGQAIRHETDVDRDGDRDLLFHFRVKETGYNCKSTDLLLTGETFAGKTILSSGSAAFGRDFPIGQDWTRAEALSFWFYGTNSGESLTVQVKDNRAPDPGPSGWSLAWSDEFNSPAGTPPNPANWSYEIGDGAINRIPGWGNNELQYYTDSTENSATDGAGNLVITTKEADGSLVCYYGPCEYTSARLISQYKAEFAYGRLESRILVPQGAGLWPAFWSLGTDIGEVGWPQTGEIDFMEFVGRLPNEIFGTIHGPGYSGGNSFGNVYDFGEPVFNDFHTFAVEWEPDLIKWYVDDNLYHTATPADVAPNQWVFNDPVFLLLNVAVGGNFGGPVGVDTTFPQEMVIDYVRVYQGPDTAEKWEASFTDDFTGWQQVIIPFTALTRSADQPAGAPDDGLNLDEVWGYGFELPRGGTPSGVIRLDQVRLELLPPPTAITVTNLNNSGAGSLRQAMTDIAPGGTITFEPGLAGGTLALNSGPLVAAKSVVIDASAAPGIRLDGGGVDRVLIVNAGQTVEVAHLVVANGYGFQLAGGILNNGTLTLDHVAVTGNTMTTDAGDFWQGGGGIYSGDGATLTLIDSTVADNFSGWTGGGIYTFFNTTTTLIRSTVSGNIAADVAGGLRTLGNVIIDNSTISGNTSTTWHGGGAFITDGVATITNSTVTGNNAPGGTAGGLFVGTFGPSSATLNIQNTIVANNGDFGCFLAPFGAGAVALNSLGNNVSTDGTCAPVGSDQVVGDAGLGLLADNGGPTQTHALLAGSPAIDAANTAVCPATDQRGVARDAACDVGAYEYVP
jgi:beta-glucanase (GH16 family)